MASFATTEAASAAAQTMSIAMPPRQQIQQLQLQQQQQQQQQQQLQQQLQHQQQQQHSPLQQQFPNAQPLQQQQQQQQQQFIQSDPSDVGQALRNGAHAGGAEGAGSSSSMAGSGSPGNIAGNNNSLNLGLGFLRGLGLERKTNRDGQPPKRRGPKPDSKPALTRRQELNRQAQRTHRQRKEVYIKSLEDQVMQLKELFAAQAQERVSVDEENRRLRQLLQLHGIQIPGEMLQQLSQLQALQNEGLYHANFSPSDGGMGQSASDYATPSSYHASGSEAGGPIGPGSAMSASSDGTLHLTQPHAHMQQQHQHQQPQQMHGQTANQMLQDHLIQGSLEENQLGIDFVLALEAFCRDHQQYLCVRSSQSIESAEPVASGHALMLSCPPASHIQTNPDQPYPHQAPAVPTASLASLLQSARQLPLVGDGEITPIMVLSFIQSDARYSQMTIKEFIAVRKVLEEKTRCYGFGAVLEEFEVRDALENIFSGRVPTA